MTGHLRGLSWKAARGPGEQRVCPQAHPETGRAVGRGLTLPAQGDAEGRASLWVPYLGHVWRAEEEGYIDPNPK